MRAGEGSRLAEAGSPGGFWIDNPNQVCNLEVTDVVNIKLGELLGGRMKCTR